MWYPAPEVPQAFHSDKNKFLRWRGGELLSLAIRSALPGPTEFMSGSCLPASHVASVTTLYISLSIYLSTYLSVYLHLYLYLYLYLCLSVYLSDYLSTSPSIHPSIHASTSIHLLYPSTHASTSIHLIYLSVYTSICISLCGGCSRRTSTILAAVKTFNIGA